MRKRLTVAFVLLTLAVLATAGLVCSAAVRDLINEQQTSQLQTDARLIARLANAQLRDGEPIDRAFVQQVVPPNMQVTVTARSQRVSVNGEGYERGGEQLAETATVGEARVELRQSESVVSDIFARSIGIMLVTLLLLLILAAVAAWWLARMLSEPFVRLALAADALGRGRFDLDLPDSNIREVQAISRSLSSTAGHLQEALVNDREFVRHASHVLRTPLTGLRLELEDLSQRQDVDEDVRQTAQRSMGDVRVLDETVEELIAFTRSRRLAAGSEVSLHDLARHVGRRWREILPPEAEVRVFVEGEDRPLTPGPVEQILDHVLEDIVDLHAGQVTMRCDGQRDLLGISITVYGATRDVGSTVALERALSLAEAMGGRITGETTDELGLVVLLPWR